MYDARALSENTVLKIYSLRSDAAYFLSNLFNRISQKTSYHRSFRKVMDSIYNLDKPICAWYSSRTDPRAVMTAACCARIRASSASSRIPSPPSRLEVSTIEATRDANCFPSR
mmetsp:Transcript_10926/g.27685  ORF Transcript_10926/g.27685 Transcript_10926/m.27685 type:complete len:113 (-) Transcript_10926:2180-2518(-)